MLSFTKRNLKLYFKDYSGVIFSLIGVFVIIMLYAIFLADSLMDSMSMLLYAKTTVDVWVMAGILQVATLTTATGALNVMLEDYANQKIKDFYVLPISKRSITRGYFLNAYCVSIIMSLVTLIACIVYLAVARDYYFEVAVIVKTIGLLLLCSFSSTALVYFIMSFIKSGTAFNAISVFVGTFSGFITGVYFPIGSVNETVQKVMMLFPLSHGSSLLRKVLLEDINAKNFVSASSEIQLSFEKTLGVVFEWSGKEISTSMSVIYLLVSGIIFLILGNLIVSKRK